MYTGVKFGKKYDLFQYRKVVYLFQFSSIREGHGQVNIYWHGDVLKD